MRILVIGSTGCIGRSVCQALRARGHTVVAAARSLADEGATLHVDYMQACPPERWAQRLAEARIDALVNCVGILIPRKGQSFERVHADGPIELFRGARRAGVRRIVQISALGAGDEALDVPYLASKLRADDALAALGVEYAVLRPSLVFGPRSASGGLFATLASLPVVALPGRGTQAVQPIHVYEVAEIVARLLEQRLPLQGVFELGGPAALSYCGMLATYRQALGLADALWLPVPMPLMKLGARLAEQLPQTVFSRDTLGLLERGNTSAGNAAAALLGRAPTALAEGLRMTPPQPRVDLRVNLSPALSWLLHGSVALLWLYTALISALLPQTSGVLELLARCGFEGDAGVAALIASCTLNTGLGLALLQRRPAPWTYALQIGAVLGYTLTAAINMPELTIDHCGPLAKNVPLLALLVVLWCGTPAQPVALSDAAPRGRRPAASRPSPGSRSAPASRRTAARPSAP